VLAALFLHLSLQRRTRAWGDEGTVLANDGAAREYAVRIISELIDGGGYDDPGQKDAAERQILAHAFIYACQRKDVDACADLWGGRVVMGKKELNAKTPVAPVEMTKDLCCPISAHQCRLPNLRKSTPLAQFGVHCWH
jgi:hypothetical protein